MTFLDPILDLFRGKAVTIPPMDGALKPNTALDEAEVVVAALAPSAEPAVIVRAMRLRRRMLDINALLLEVEFRAFEGATTPGGL